MQERVALPDRFEDLAHARQQIRHICRLELRLGDMGEIKGGVREICGRYSSVGSAASSCACSLASTWRAAPGGAPPDSRRRAAAAASAVTSCLSSSSTPAAVPSAARAWAELGRVRLR